MIVYHGTDSYSAQNIMEAGIDLARGEESVDNARGFYTTPSREFALRRARMTTAAVGKFRKDATLRPAVLEIEIDGDALKKLNVLEFTGTTYQWKEFVFYNRQIFGYNLRRVPPRANGKGLKVPGECSADALLKGQVTAA